MPDISVTKLSENQLMKFRVKVAAGNGLSEYLVTLNKVDYQRLTSGHVKPEELIRHSIEYLLEHESPRQILSEFDFTAIGRYFPQFTREIRKRIGVE